MLIPRFLNLQVSNLFIVMIVMNVFTTACRFFWDTVVRKHTWVMGGNSTGEHFFAPEEFEHRIELNGGPESCNSVNMLLSDREFIL